jgi:hypothetical protein
VLTKYRKSITALVTGILGWGGVVVASESADISAPEWLFLGVVVATALGVYNAAANTETA